MAEVTPEKIAVTEQAITIDDPAQDPFISAFLMDMPQEIRSTFSGVQLQAIKEVFEKKQWGIHPMDVRSSIGIWRWRFYFVFIAGRDRRVLSKRRYKFMQATVLSFMVVYLVSSVLLGLLALYLIKSALGIDLISGFSFGIWDWFKGLACAE